MTLVVISRVISMVSVMMTLFRALFALLVATHEPPSKHNMLHPKRRFYPGCSNKAKCMFSCRHWVGWGKGVGMVFLKERLTLGCSPLYK